MHYKPIKTEFEGRADQKGFLFKQLKREGQIALFKKNKGTVENYEVIIIRNQEEYEMGGIKIEAKEHYPNAREFGTYGWSYQTLDSAEKKFKELKRNEN